jgi:hypothetical protein
MSELAKAHRLLSLLRDVPAAEAEVAQYAENTPAGRHARDRLNNLRADIERAKSGRWCGPNT